MTSALSLAGGVSLAAVPASTLSISSRVFDTPGQGAISFAVAAATFVGQLVFAAVVESRLSSAATERRVVFPFWLAVVSVIASLAVVVVPTSVVVVCVALPVLVAGLEVGRGVSVAERLDTREIVAAIAVGLGALLGLGAAYLDADWGFAALALGITAATVVRCLPVAHRASRPDPRITSWVIADVAVTGSLYPALNLLVLASLGPAEAFVFASISTVSGLLAIPLNFMRLRLLKSHSRADVVLSAGTVAVGAALILVGEWTGLLAFLFGDSWSASATIGPILIACLWRASSLATTLPFAALRRAGRARLLTLLRGACAAATLLAAVATLPAQSTAVTFGVLLAGELAQAIVYELARRRLGVPIGAAR